MTSPRPMTTRVGLSRAELRFLACSLRRVHDGGQAGDERLDKMLGRLTRALGAMEKRRRKMGKP